MLLSSPLSLIFMAARGAGAAVVAWILATGAWNDSAPYDDTQAWKDS